MNRNNLFSSICTDLTLEKAKENLKKERTIEKEKEKEKGTVFISNSNKINEVEYAKNENENSDDEEIRKWRENRLQELKKRTELKKDGVYLEITEKEFLPTILKSYCVVCHFYDYNFKRCKILDKHLIRLANIHLTTKFIKMEAKSSPFFINKLKIKVLPSLCLFIGGVLTHTSIGFEDFGNRDDFTTKDLEQFLHKMKLLNTMEYSEDEEEPINNSYF